MLTTIPFSGFYCSLHESALDDAVEQMFSDRATGCTVYRGLADRAQGACDWREVMKAYAAEYAEQFSREFDIPLEFDSLESPRFYNFTTDRIFCRVPLEVCTRLFLEVDDDTLEATARDMFTSRDGFSSFYSPDVSEWGDVSEWDHNQIECLIAAYVAQQNPDFDQYAEFDLMESARCNSGFDSWIGTNTPTIDRLYKVYDYLEQRAERA